MVSEQITPEHRGLKIAIVATDILHTSYFFLNITSRQQKTKIPEIRSGEHVQMTSSRWLHVFVTFAIF